MKLLIVSIYITFSLFMFSCIQESDTENQQPVAQVESYILTVKELSSAIPENLSVADSTSFAQNYIARWVKRMLLLRKAELNLSAKEKDVAQLLEDYRASLLVHKYQQKLLEQKYAPDITNSEIEAYFEDMKDNFALQQTIVKGMFIKVPLTAPNLNTVKALFKSDKEEDVKALEAYCYQNANKFENFADKWTETTKFNALMPEPVPNDSRFFKKNELFETQDSIYVYYLYINEYKLKNELAPVEFVKGRIESILLNKNRIKFIQNLEEELYEEGLEQKQIKFYE
ncbi:hypothetical protein [Saccharicrinis aurantiacus]|uniref:hypothetical protein n=1 Tax=Saccharicrinis aurantiacus TaxID=1849719 RepID=UPI0024934838|nr:hypothetical protein [Saccharicrinis aurantiacus]